MGSSQSKTAAGTKPFSEDHGVFQVANACAEVVEVMLSTDKQSEHNLNKDWSVSLGGGIPKIKIAQVEFKAEKKNTVTTRTQEFIEEGYCSVPPGGLKMFQGRLTSTQVVFLSIRVRATGEVIAVNASQPPQSTVIVTPEKAVVDAASWYDPWIDVSKNYDYLCRVCTEPHPKPCPPVEPHNSSEGPLAQPPPPSNPSEEVPSASTGQTPDKQRMRDEFVRAYLERTRDEDDADINQKLGEVSIAPVRTEVSGTVEVEGNSAAAPVFKENLRDHDEPPAYQLQDPLAQSTELTMDKSSEWKPFPKAKPDSKPGMDSEASVENVKAQFAAAAKERCMVLHGLPEEQGEDLEGTVRCVFEEMRLPALYFGVVEVARIGQLNPDKGRPVRVEFEKIADAQAFKGLSSTPKHRIRRTGVYVAEYRTQKEMKEFYQKQKNQEAKKGKKCGEKRDSGTSKNEQSQEARKGKKCGEKRDSGKRESGTSKNEDRRSADDSEEAKRKENFKHVAMYRD